MCLYGKIFFMETNKILLLKLQHPMHHKFILGLQGQLSPYSDGLDV
jgi:hypothetical protein